MSFTAGFAQIGINNPNPDPSAVLDLKSDTSGLLIPRMTATQRRAITIAANGLLVFDETDQLFYYYDSSYSNAAARWTGLDAWRFRDDLSDFDLGGFYRRNAYSHYSVNNVGIKVQDPIHKLDINGNLSIGDSTVSLGHNDVYVAAGIITGTSIESDDTIKADLFEGYGTVPLGTIIMCACGPTDLPDGWALCDGSSTYTDHFGVVRPVPDLSGRFIVGTGAASGPGAGATNYGAGATGGEQVHTLTISEMPGHDHGGSTSTNGSHSHSYNDRTVNRTEVSFFLTGANQGIGGIDDEARTTGIGGAHNHTINSQGSSSAHENRPPYYALAFIIRVN